VATKQQQFSDWGDLGLAFLQNLLGNSISF
jgi:hypothetical protein